MKDRARLPRIGAYMDGASKGKEDYRGCSSPRLPSGLQCLRPMAGMAIHESLDNRGVSTIESVNAELGMLTSNLKEG